MSIRINVTDLLNYELVHEDIDESYSIDDFDLGSEHVHFNAPIHLKGTFTRVKSGILLDAIITAEVTLNCSRCLDEFKTELRFDIHEAYSLPERTSQFEGYEEVFTIEPGGTIDIEPAISENISLNIPVKPLCSDDCRGICPVCGTNLNEEQCSCELPGTGSAFDVLKKLKDSL